LAVWTGRGDLESRGAAPVGDESRFKITHFVGMNPHANSSRVRFKSASRCVDEL
jgi:hypothetical protein